MILKSFQKSYEVVVYAKHVASRAKFFHGIQYSGKFEYNQDKS